VATPVLADKKCGKMWETELRLRAPIYIHLDLTRSCNFRCPFCQIRNDSEKIVLKPISHFKTILKKIAEAEVFEVSFFGGEPFLYPKIYELGQYSKKLRLYTGFLSNGSLIREKDIKKVLNSFDAGSFALHGFSETHDKIVKFPGSWQNVVKLIKLFVEKNFKIGINTTVMKRNVKEMEEFIPYALELGINFMNINIMIPFSKIEYSEKLDLFEIRYLLRIVDKNRKKFTKQLIKIGTTIPHCFYPKKFRHLRNFMFTWHKIWTY
jgi:MoaA/NifB/PqqE/SkfB family radical SAM enzyme